MQDFEELTATIARLEKHVQSQDVEVYRQQRLIDGLQKQVKKLQERIIALEEGGDAMDVPADERPPHY